MKVLQLTTSDYFLSAGADIAAQRLHLALRRAGIDSKILCSFKELESSHTIQIPRSKQEKIIEALIKRVTSRLGLNFIHHVSSFRINKLQTYLDADILHLHEIHDGLFSYLALPSLAESKPAVFTLHDMWPITGHCGYSYDCERWKIGCGKCPYPDTWPPIKRDNTRLEWKLKDWVYSRSNLTIVSPSSWLTEQAKQSMLKRFSIHQIPHGIDTEIYQPLDSEQCRSLLRIPPRKKVLMFGAQSWKDYRKGGDLLLKALQSLPVSLKAETVLLTMGQHGGEPITETVGIQTLNLAYIYSDYLKAIAYSAADLFLFPTRSDIFGLVSIESQACGTPVVSFRVCGVPDHVRPGITGYLAEPENAKDFCDGIVQLLEDEPLHSRMSQQCRAIALKEYSLELQVQRYIELYRQLLQNGVA